MQRVAKVCLWMGVGLLMVSLLTFGVTAIIPVEWRSLGLANVVLALMVYAFTLGAGFLAIGLVLMAIAVIRKVLAQH